MHKYDLLIFFLLAFFTSNAQNIKISDTTLTEIHARLLSAADSTPVPFANIVLSRNYSGTTTNEDGFFSINILKTDSLIVTSIGYKKTIIEIPPYFSCIDTLVFYMQPVKYSLGEVNVIGKRKKSYYFEKEELPEMPIDPRPGQVYVTIPISLLYHYLNKKEKQKREYQREMEITKSWEEHSIVYNKETVSKITGLNEAYADTFMTWLNAKEILLYNSSEYKIYSTISQSINEFLIEYNVK